MRHSLCQTAPLQDIERLLTPLVIELQEELQVHIKLHREAEEKLGDLINVDEDRMNVISQQYEVINRNADVLTLRFKLKYFDDLINGKLK